MGADGAVVKVVGWVLVRVVVWAMVLEMVGLGP